MRFPFLIFALTFFFTNSAFGQIGKSHAEVQKIYPSTTPIKHEGKLLVEDKEVSKNEVRMIAYNGDSIAVFVSICRADSFFSDSAYKKMLSEELPQFRQTKSAQRKGNAYLIDSINNCGIILIADQLDKGALKKCIVFCSDLYIIEDWIKDISIWKRE